MAAGVGVVAVVGGGALAWQLWAAQGPQPSEALPDSTLAYLAVDLDPSGGQKLAAYDALRKFPSLKEELGLDGTEDLRRSIVDGIADGGGCDLDYDAVKAWAGDRFAFAVVAQDKPEPVVVLQVGDRDTAATGLAAAARDCGDESFGVAFDDEWAVLARNDEVARRVVADAHRKGLQTDGEFRELTGAAGDSGVVTAYVAPEAGPAVLEAVEKDPFLAVWLAAPLTTPVDPVSTALGWAMLSAGSFAPGSSAMDSYGFGDESDTDSYAVGGGADAVGMPEMSKEQKALMRRLEHADQLSESEQQELWDDWDAFTSKQLAEAGYPEGELGDDELDMPEIPAELRTALEGFTGLGGTVRFDDGALEAEVVADPVLGGTDRIYAGTAGGSNVAALPADTAVAFGGGFADGWADRVLAGLEGSFLGFGEDQEDVRKALEEATGLSVPEDLEALGGDSIALVARAGFDPTAEGDPSQLAVAARITGDADRIEAALAKLRGGLDDSASEDVAPYLQSRRVDGGIAVGPNSDYLAELADPRDRLGDSDRYAAAVPDADAATSVTYVDFDADDWLVHLAGSDRKDAAPLDTAGLTVTDEGDRQHIRLRITFD